MGFDADATVVYGTNIADEYGEIDEADLDDIYTVPGVDYTFDGHAAKDYYSHCIVYGRESRIWAYGFTADRFDLEALNQVDTDDIERRVAEALGRDDLEFYWYLVPSYG